MWERGHGLDLLASRAKWRTLAILALMYAILLQLGYIVALVAGYQVGLGAIVVVSVIALIVDAYSYWRCDKIVVRITGAVVVSAHEAPELHSIVEELCIASGLPKPAIAIVDDPSLNAAPPTATIFPSTTLQYCIEEFSTLTVTFALAETYRFAI